MASSADRLLDHLPHAPRRQMLGDEVYESLKALIMNHVLEPGSRLTIDALTRELGTSSTPVREALARLEADGLAAKLPLKGYSVAPMLDQNQVAELYQLRLLLEPWAAGEAAAQATPADIERLHQEMATCPEAPEGGSYESYRNFSVHDARLHDLILELAGNETIRRTFTRCRAHLHLFRVAAGKELTLHAAAEHRAIVQAIATGKRKTGADAMRAHLEAARDRVVRTPT